MSCGSMLANCFFNCGVRLGTRLPASFSNSALVQVVLQSVEGVFAAGVAPGVAAVPAAGAAFAGAEQTPLTVSTTASAGTEAEVSLGFASSSVAPPARAGGGVPGAACPQAIAPNKTHSSQLLRINYFPPGLVHQKIEKY